MIIGVLNSHVLIPTLYRLLTETRPSTWPPGPYSLLMPRTGCPEPMAHGWQPGYINFTLKHPLTIQQTTYKPVPEVDIRNDTDTFVNRNVSKTIVFPRTFSGISILGPFGKYSFQINFCSKMPSKTNSESTDWPTGMISHFGAIEGCPNSKLSKCILINCLTCLFSSHSFFIRIEKRR